MTIRTREQDVPSDFPPARLFLDDLEEMVNILRELAATATRVADSAMTSVTFSFGNQDSDDIADLRRITKRNPELKITVQKDWTRTLLSLRPLTYWTSTGYTKQDRWSAYHRLELIFKRRKRRWPTFFQSLSMWQWTLMWVLIWAAITSVLFATVPARLKTTDSLSVALLVSAGISIVMTITGLRHTSVVLRYSWEQSPLWAYLKDRIVPIVASALLAIFSTLLGLYIKHKYWP